jgi:hypothetical protein
MRARSRDSARGCNGEHMRKTLLLVGILIFAGTARAQAAIGGSINNLGSIGSGGSLNGAAGMNAGALTTGSVPSAPSVAGDYLVNQNSANPGPFVPSTFTSYGEAVELGETGSGDEADDVGRGGAAGARAKEEREQEERDCAGEERRREIGNCADGEEVAIRLAIGDLRFQQMATGEVGRGGWRSYSRLRRTELRLAGEISAGTCPRAGGRRLRREHKLPRAFPPAG